MHFVGLFFVFNWTECFVYRDADKFLARPGRKQATATRFWVSYILFIIIIGGILVLFMYITRLTSNDIFSPSNKINREVGWAKDLSAPVYVCQYMFCLIVYLVCLCSVMLLNGFVLLTCFHHNHFLLHSTHALIYNFRTW